MQVRKRSGELVPVSFDKILKRITQISNGLNKEFVDPGELSKKVIEGLVDGISTKELDTLTAEIAATLTAIHPDYSVLAAKITISNLYKETDPSFSKSIELLYQNTSLINDDLYAIVSRNKELIDSKIKHSRDLMFDYFGFKTLEKSYLLKIKNQIIERPQFMWMRVAIGIWGDNLAEAFNTYNMMSKGNFTHATPTLFNAGTKQSQLSSCFLIANKGDSLEDIMSTCADVAKISSCAGGIGIHVHDIRAEGSHIHKSGGTSNGLLPLMKTYNELARWWDQCFEKHTKVETDKGLVALKDIVEGMSVRTSDGNFNKVLKVNRFRVKESRELIELVIGGIRRRVTGKHCFLIIKGEQLTEVDDLKSKLKRGIVKIQWVEAEKIEVQDLVIKYEYVNSNETKSVDSIYQYEKRDFDIPYIEEISSLGLNIDELIFESVISTKKVTSSEDVIDLEVEGLHNYQTEIGLVHNGGGRRKGAFAIYLEPWHKDISTFLDIRKNHGKEELRARDLFNALWIPDLFMKRVEENTYWTLFCPNEVLIATGSALQSVYGEEFEELYIKCENLGIGKKIEARVLWQQIVEVQMETGTPYMLFKDAINEKSNQKNIGVIKSSNLCAEICEVSTPEEQAVCNLASIALPKCIIDNKFDFATLIEITRQITKNLNQVIDINYYPTKETKASNLKHRPIGIGVQGLADTFAILGYDFDSLEARELNKQIFETIYYGALLESCNIAKKTTPYSSFKGSPLSEGIFQFDMWKVKAEMYDWDSLRKDIIEYGVSNSLLVALMPTASTSNILGNNECFEPFNSNLSTRGILAGTFPIINKHLIRDLEKLGLWSKALKNKLVLSNGSIQSISEIPLIIRNRYRTVYEISQKVVIDMAADRGAFICQSQSMNLFMQNVNVAKLTSMHFYAWKAGLKTGMYYLRTKAAVDAIKFTADKQSEEDIKSDLSCSLDNPTDCEACGA